MLMAPPLPVLTQLLNVDELTLTSLLLTADTYSTSIAPPRVELLELERTTFTVTSLSEATPFTVLDTKPP